MQAIADLVGLTVEQMTVLGIAGAVLVVGWFVLRTALKMARRLFAIGCVGIIVVVGVLYFLYAFAR